MDTERPCKFNLVMCGFWYGTLNSRFLIIRFYTWHFVRKDTEEEQRLYARDSILVENQVTSRGIVVVAKNKRIELYKSMRLLRSIEWL